VVAKGKRKEAEFVPPHILIDKAIVNLFSPANEKSVNQGFLQVSAGKGTGFISNPCAAPEQLRFTRCQCVARGGMSDHASVWSRRADFWNCRSEAVCTTRMGRVVLLCGK
jgi:hypothetical protein